MDQHTISLLRCPICGGAFSQREKSLVCGRGHCYDIARQGHVNLVPGRKESFYTRELFESRAQVFRAGVYDRVIAAVTDAVCAHMPERETPVLLDAGCGEGFYTRSVCPQHTMTRIGFDLSKDAVRLAAAADKGSCYFVGDLAHIPLADGCVDVLLDVFTPANYAQFGRVLSKGGLLIKLAPRSGYLRELRQAAAAQLRSADYDGGKVESYAAEHMKLLDQRIITYTLPVDAQLVAHLARMTPMLAGVDIRCLDLSGIDSITIDETMYIGTIESGH